nr:protein phosphatase 2C 16-like isoform X1 [Tanacetum cinerariifolium]
MSRDVIVVHEMFNGGVEMLSLYMRWSTDESRCYHCTLDVQQRSRDAIGMAGFDWVGPGLTREDEYARIKEDGGKVIRWDGHHVFGALAISRSIGMLFYALILSCVLNVLLWSIFYNCCSYVIDSEVGKGFAFKLEPMNL